MTTENLRRNLVETALAAESRALVELPTEFHGADQQRRGEMAAWIVQSLLERAASGDQAAIAFWRHRNRPHRLPPKQTDLPSVGLYSPGLGLGGAERWIVDLGRHLDRSRLHLAGLGILSLPADGPLLAKAHRSMPVYLGPEACDMLARSVDVLVFWGTGELTPISAPERTIYVSHGAGACAKHWAPLVAAKRIHLAAVSQWAARIFPPEKPVEIVWNGVDTSRLNSRVPRQTIRQRWGLKPDEIAIGYIGRFSYEKNPMAAAVAAAELGPPYGAVYVGPSHPQGAQILGQFDPPPVQLPRTEQIGDVLRGLDCLVLASRTEGFSLALTEAWYCGVPTVATPVGAVPELEEQFGALTVRVPMEASAVELAEGVKKALAPENRAVVERARAVTREHFTAAAMGRRWSEYLLKLAGVQEKTVESAP